MRRYLELPRARRPDLESMGYVNPAMDDLFSSLGDCVIPEAGRLRFLKDLVEPLLDDFKQASLYVAMQYPYTPDVRVCPFKYTRHYFDRSRRRIVSEDGAEGLLEQLPEGKGRTVHGASVPCNGQVAITSHFPSTPITFA